MRVVVRTTPESTSADTTSADTNSLTPASDASTTGDSPAPPTGEETGPAGPAPATRSDAEEAESRPRRVPAEEPVTCHGYSEGEHGLKLTDANGEKCGYVPYAELLRIVPE